MSRFNPTRAAARQVRNLILPRPATGLDLPVDQGPLVVAGMFKTANGMGQSARSCVQALRENGFDPTLVDLSDLFNQADSHPELELQKMPSSSSGTLILHANAPETERALLALKLRRWHNWRIIGYWAWELTHAPSNWLRMARHLTEIWTPSEFVSDVFRDHVQIPVRTVPPRLTAPSTLTKNQQVGAQEGRPLSCLTMADGRSSFHRKNILASVRMFKAAFDTGQDVSQTLKLRNLDEFPNFKATLRDAINGDDRIQILDGSMSSAERWDIIGDCDIMLSAHRSEGYGLHLAEAMLLGRCVVATDWSGNKDFMTHSNSALLPFELEQAEDTSRIYNPPTGSMWARVDEDAGVETLRNLADNPDIRQRLGEAAQLDTSASLDGSAYIQALHATSTPELAAAVATA